MMPGPKKQHQLVAHRLRTQLEPQLGTDLVLIPGTDMEDAALGILRVPGLVVIDGEEATADSDAVDPRRCHLVIEIVSRSDPDNDYEGKLRDYPAALPDRRPPGRDRPPSPGPHTPHRRTRLRQ